MREKKEVWAALSAYYPISAYLTIDEQETFSPFM
jgi:hypothetical protein